MSVKPVPHGYHTVTPWIVSRDTPRGDPRRIDDPEFTAAMEYVQSAGFFPGRTSDPG